jgi:glycine hydroxymethyltransferase
MDLLPFSNHAGANANMAVYLAFLKPGDTVMGMSLDHGGHLTHGSPANASGKLYNFVSYKLSPSDERIDMDAVRDLAREHRPKIIVAGATAYPRRIDAEPFRAICDEVGALFLFDAAHIAGLIAGGAHPSPVPYADVVTLTTHKTLRGPRAGAILCRDEHATAIDKSVFPGLQGGPHMNTIAAIAVTLKKAQEPAFRRYAEQVLRNARALAERLLQRDATLVTGGTDNHMLVVDTMASAGIDGRAAERRLDAVGITTNKQIIPDDPLPPLRPSGIRLGTPAATTRGMREAEMHQLADWIADTLHDGDDPAPVARRRRAVEELCAQFPVPAL